MADPPLFDRPSISSILPLDVLEQICRSALAAFGDHDTAGQHPLSSLSLLTLDSSWHLAASRVVYEKLVLPDDDELLLLASDPFPEANRSVIEQSRICKQLRAIVQNDIYASAVTSLEVVPGRPVWREVEASPNNGVSDGSEEPGIARVQLIQPDPLDDSALHDFIRSRLASLQSFTWSASRPPPDAVIDALSCSRSLSSFTAWSALSSSSPTPFANDASDASNLRWDALSLPFLPMETLSTLTLHSLSYEGIRSLHNILGSLVACEELVLGNTLFVDDPLLDGLAENLIRLRSLAIRNMAGTKVTNKGIAALMEGSAALEELELTEFEGRLTKKCWAEIDSYPPSFKSLKIAFSEGGTTHHSWTVDHLQSISSFLNKVQALETFSITRLVPAEAELPLQHELVNRPPLLQPKPLPDGFLAALTKHFNTLKIVEIDFWEISLERTKTLLETCPGLLRFALMFDAPFGKLLNMSSTFLLMQRLQTFRVAIPPRNTAAIKDVMSAVTAIKSSSDARTVSGYVSTPPAFPPASNVDDSGCQLKSPRARRGSIASLSGMAAVPALPKDVAPALRDMKKLAKRCGALYKIEWLGRGAAGIWDINRSISAREPKVTFTPINELFERRNSAAAQARTDLSVPARDEGEDVALPMISSPIMKRTRGITSSSYTSTSSFASMSTSSSSNTTAPRSPVLGLGNALRGSPTSFKRGGIDLPGEQSPSMSRASSAAMAAAKKARSKSVSVENTAGTVSPETPTRNRMVKSKSISSVAGLGMANMAGVREEPRVVKVVHGGGWVSRRTKSSSGSLKFPPAPAAIQQPTIAPPALPTAHPAATPSSSDVKKSERDRHRHSYRRDRKSKQNLRVDTSATPAPLTAENLKAVPSTASKVEFPDLPLQLATTKEEKPILKSDKAKKEDTAKKTVGLGKNGTKGVGMGKPVTGGQSSSKK